MTVQSTVNLLVIGAKVKSFVLETGMKLVVAMDPPFVPLMVLVPQHCKKLNDVLKS